jgi:hypothetical protein
MRGALVTIAIVALAGCATMINGSSQTVHLLSQPPGAQVEVSGQSAVTPAAVQLPRSSTHVVRFRKAGYEDAERLIGQRMSGYVFLDYMLGIVPVLVDYSTGGFYELDPTLVEVHLNERVR